MKKILLLFLVVLYNCDVFAQNSYVRIYKYSDYIFYFDGEIPSEIASSLTPTSNDTYAKDYTYKYSFNDTYGNEKRTYFYWINLFASYGYELEFMGNELYKGFILSKPSTPSSSSIPRVQADENIDEEVYEVARYNLQGIPVRKTEKGVQIIVYSNYTTKTVIVE